MNRARLALVLVLLTAACGDDAPAAGTDGPGRPRDAAARADAPRADAAADGPRAPDAGADATRSDGPRADGPPPVDARPVDAQPADAAGADLLARLNAIPGMVAMEVTSDVRNHRQFEITYQQPVDHDAPMGAQFSQRMRLLHRSPTAPMVFGTEGYGLFDRGYREELTQLLSANQISVEHRFFPPSRPMPADWSKLVIRQAAADHHRVAAALRPLYAGRWLATGASKGGMTTTYFRRFYPDDVYASVPYVAPQSMGTNDQRYTAFLDQVGAADCRDKLKAFQRVLLAQRDAMEMRMTASGTAFAQLGLDVAFEHAVIEMRFGFWQYGTAAGCATIPAATATPDELYAGFDRVAQLSAYGDAEVEAFAPYYYQAATQLGAPGFTEPHLLDVLRHAAEYGPLPYCPTGVAVPAFDTAAMPDVGGWLAGSGERFLFVYGENDPWSAGAFTLPDAARDNHKLVVPAGNHGSGILDLPEPARTEALAAISRWSGVTAMPAAVTLPHRAIVELRRRPGPLPHLAPEGLR